jgi:hypothetical protein
MVTQHRRSQDLSQDSNLNVGGNDLAGLFLKEFVKSIFLVLHPEIMSQPDVKDNNSKNSQSSGFISSRQAGQKIIKLPAFKPTIKPMNFQPSVQQGQFRGPRQIAPGILPVPIPSYKIQQYFAKNKEWPTINIPAKGSAVQLNSSDGQMMPSLGSKISGSAETKIDNTKLGSLIYLLSDSSVSSLECPGPGKPIVLNKSGNMENSSMTFSQDDIKAVMDEISRKTGQKFDSGFVKAAIGNFIVSAVISDFVGTRFVIQKLPSASSGEKQ